MDSYWWTGLKGCSRKWTKRIISRPFSIESRGRNSNKPRIVRADPTSCSHAFFSPLFQRVVVVTHTEIGPSAVYHLTANGDLVQSDLKVPPDWFCPHSGEWWISPRRCIPCLAARQSHWWGLRGGTGLDPAADDGRPLVWPVRWDDDPRCPLSGPLCFPSPLLRVLFDKCQASRGTEKALLPSFIVQRAWKLYPTPKEEERVWVFFPSSSSSFFAALMLKPVNDTVEHRYH